MRCTSAHELPWQEYNPAIHRAHTPRRFWKCGQETIELLKKWSAGMEQMKVVQTVVHIWAQWLKQSAHGYICSLQGVWKLFFFFFFVWPFLPLWNQWIEMDLICLSNTRGLLISAPTHHCNKVSLCGVLAWSCVIKICQPHLNNTANLSFGFQNSKRMSWLYLGIDTC